MIGFAWPGSLFIFSFFILLLLFFNHAFTLWEDTKFEDANLTYLFMILNPDY